MAGPKSGMTMERDMSTMYPGVSSAVLLVASLTAGCATTPEAPEVPAGLEVVKQPTGIVRPAERIDTIAIRVVDSRGMPVSGVRVNWTGHGTIQPHDSISDHDGMVRARWLLPAHGEPYRSYSTGPSGRFTVSASITGGLGVTLSVEALAFQVESIWASFQLGCGLRADSLYCWNDDRRTARGTTTYHVPLPDGVVAKSVRLTEYSFCLLDQNGLPWCRRALDAGAGFLPVQQAPPLRTLYHNGSTESTERVCGLAVEDGSVWCWPVARAVALAASRQHDMTFTAAASGINHQCGLDADGFAWCWGSNSDGQLGNGTTVSSDDPQPVTGGFRFKAIVAGDRNACAAALDGAVYCWGRSVGSSGLLVPTLLDDPESRGGTMFMGDMGELYVLRGRRVRVWHNGQRLGLDSYFEPLQVIDMAVFGSICAITVSGETFCSATQLFPIIYSTLFPTELTAVAWPDPD